MKQKMKLTHGRNGSTKRNKVTTVETSQGTVSRAVTMIMERKTAAKMDAYEGERACPSLGRNQRIREREEDKRKMKKNGEKVRKDRVLSQPPHSGRLSA